MNAFKATLLASGLAVATAAGAAAETYRWSTWQADTDQASIANRWFVEELAKATNGAITFEYFGGAVLMPAKAQLQGIGDGVAEGGHHTPGYTPSELPLSNAVSGFAFLEPNATAIGAAFADWVMHDPVVNAEWTGHNVVPLGGFSTPLYPIVCNTAEPITELAQLQGLKIRFPGGANATLAKDLGAVPVNIPANEIYMALQNGQIDCAGILAAWLNIDNKLEEVSKSTTLMNWASAFQTPLQQFNKDFWQGLTDDQRKTIFELSARSQAKLQIAFNALNEKALADAASRGHVVVEPGESIKAAVNAWVANGVGDMAGVARNTLGIQDPAALFASFEPYVKKWGDLVRGMKDPTSEDELAQLLLDHMFNDLDPATYGMK